MNWLRDKKQEREELHELIMNANPALRVVGRGLVIIDDELEDELEDPFGFNDGEELLE